jgi:hypothetical protein
MESLRDHPCAKKFLGSKPKSKRGRGAKPIIFGAFSVPRPKTNFYASFCIHTRTVP